MIKELKVGDKVYIREDLKDGEFYGSVSWLEGKMKAGISTISAILSLYEHGICISEDIGYFYDAKMIDWEKTRELNAKDNPTFDDLIDVAVKAKKDGVLKEVAIATRDGFDCVVAIHEDNVSTLYASSEIKHHIEYIKSLYTETFVIKEFSDTKRLKSGAKTALGNGEEVIFSNRTGVNDALWFKCNGGYSTIIPFIALKGATVTQRRGEQ